MPLLILLTEKYLQVSTPPTFTHFNFSALYRNIFLWRSLCLLAYGELYRQILKCGSYCMIKVWIRLCFTEAKFTFFYVVLTKWVFLRAATVLTVIKKMHSYFESYAESPWFQRKIKECTPVLWWLLCLIVILFHIFKQISLLLLNKPENWKAKLPLADCHSLVYCDEFWFPC